MESIKVLVDNQELPFALEAHSPDQKKPRNKKPRDKKQVYCYYYDQKPLVKLIIENEDSIYSCKFMTDQHPGLTVIIPEGYTQILENAFSEIYGLEEVVFPRSMKTISKYAFFQCYNLKALKGLEQTQITQIDIWSFGYTGIASLHLPKMLKTMEPFAFSHCSNLRKVDDLEDTLLTKIAFGAFSDCSSLERICLPTELKEIEAKAFFGCNRLTKVEGLEKTKVTEINFRCFSDCLNLAEIRLPPGLTAIYGCAFQHTAITSLEIPDGVKCLEDGSIPERVRSLKAPASLESVEEHTFSTVEELWCTLDNVRPVLYGSSYLRNGATVHIRMEDGSLVHIPRLFLSELLKDELAECLKNPNHHNIEDLIHKISSGFHRSYQVLTILALAEQFLEGEAKDAALNTAKHYAGAAAKNAYQSRRKKEARLIVETFPLTKYMLDKLLAMANENEDRVRRIYPSE